MSAAAPKPSAWPPGKTLFFDTLLRMEMKANRKVSDREVAAELGLKWPLCRTCYQPATKQCSRCRDLQTRYCSVECQIAHWKAGHAAMCRTAKRKPPPQLSLSQVLEEYKRMTPAQRSEEDRKITEENRVNTAAATDKLVAALTQKKAALKTPEQIALMDRIIGKAKKQYYSDFNSPLPFPKVGLVHHLKAVGDCADLITRVLPPVGEFDD